MPPSPDRAAGPIPSLWFVAMLAGVTAWLWPIGLGGGMPVGGDVTAFSIGVMQAYRDAVTAGRLPLWNDLWGYGFPGLAESQMGVYYPPNWALYRFLPVEAASVASLSLHAYWAAIGTYWLGRNLGLGPKASALSGFAWAGSGMSLIHLSHHWYFPTASWMPWAWGAAWMFLRRGGGRRWACGLAAILALQILPGHFQVAFTTEVTVLAIAIWSWLDAGGRDGRAFRASAVVAAAPAAGLLLAAAQVWPTLQNARLTSTQRTINYLSWLPSPPSHYINLIAAGLFHRSALWRPIAWDPFRALPEEHSPYLGLVPLFLALGALAKGTRRDPVTRLLLLLVLGGAILALGPFVPGYPALIRLPGFSFFRVPARWNAALLLALALLAGKGLDSFGSWRRPGLGIVAFVAMAASLVGLSVGTFELALSSTSGDGVPSVVAAFDRVTDSLPGAPPGAFRRVMASARTPTVDPNIAARLLREGYRRDEVSRLTLESERPRIYARELTETAVILAAMIVTAIAFRRRPRLAERSLLILAMADLLAFSRHRQVDVAPIRSLVSMSPVLARMASLPRGERTLDPLKNLPMRAGVAPIGAYRTLDRDALPFLTTIASGPPDGSLTLRALRATGATTRVFEPIDPLGSSVDDRAQRIEDPALAGWIYGKRWSESADGAAFRTFRIWQANPDASRAWLIPGSALPLDRPPLVLDVLERATPLDFRAPVPEKVEIEVTTSGPSWVLLTQLADPEWAATLAGPRGEAEVPIRPAFGTLPGGAWQAIEVPGAGRWTLRLAYEGRAARIGLLASGAAWAVWILAFAWPRRTAGRSGDSRRTGTTPTAGAAPPANPPDLSPPQPGANLIGSP